MPEETNEKSIRRGRELLCAGLIIAAVFLSLVSFISTSPAEVTLSSIGLANRVWFFAWGISTAFAVYMNLHLLADKLQFKNKLFDVVSAIGSFAVLVTVSVIGDHQWQVIIHWTTGMTFGILSFLRVVFLLWVKSHKFKQHSLLIPLVFIAAAVDVAFIFIMGLTALCEITILVVCEVVMFITNFIQKMSPGQLESEEELLDCDNNKNQTA